MIDWPPHLVRELADRRGVIMLGAGAAMSCQVPAPRSSPPSWPALLTQLAEDLEPAAKGDFEQLLERGRLLDAAQVVVDRVAHNDLQRRLHRIVNSPLIQPSRLYDSVSLLDQQVVMTTNYDKIYERYWEQLAASSDPAGEEPAPLVTLNYYDDGLIDNLRSERRLLLKLHGTAEAAHRIILSRSQYARGRHQHASFFAGVSALLLTRTVLFIGTGFNGDPDVDLLLEDAAFMARAESRHYALMPEGKTASEVQSLKSAFNVEAKEYAVTATGGHEALLEALDDLCRLVEGVRAAS